MATKAPKTLDFDPTEVGRPKDLAERLVSMKFAPNATFQDQPTAAEFADMAAVREFVYMLSSAEPINFKSSPGVGKSSFVRWMCKELGIKAVVINCPNVSPEELAVPMPQELTNADGSVSVVLDYLIYHELMDPDPKVVILEEPSRASTPVHNQLMELVQDKCLADFAIPNLLGIVACDNLTAEDGISKQYDFALADRFTTIELDPNSIPWRRALAGTFATTDLTGVFNVYKSLTPRLRYLLSPRTLEHVIWNLLNGNPAEWGLGMVNSKHSRLIDELGADKTTEIFDKIASALHTVNRTNVGEKFERALDMAITHGKTIYVEGPPGIGKTSYVRQKCSETGAAVLVLSTPVISPENLAVPFPKDGKLIIMLNKWFATPGPKILVLDEVWRCSSQVRNKLMEILQEGTLGGQPIEGLICVIALNNPKEIAGHKLNVGKPDRAQSDRFFMSLAISAQDVPWASWLLKEYGEDAEPFIEWWKECIDDLGRVFMTARTLRRMIIRYRLDLPLEQAKAYVNGEYVPVPLHELQALLAKRPLARLKAIAAKVDEYEELMSGDDGDMHPAQQEVYYAFLKAELIQLEQSRDVCVRLVAKMNQQNSINLIRSAGQRQDFWFQVLREARGAKK